MLMNLDVLEKPQQQYKVGDIITENIPFVSFDNLTGEGLLAYSNALKSAEAKGNPDLIKRIKMSVRRGKSKSENTQKYLSDLIDIFRAKGHVYYSDKITQLEVFEWTFMTK